MSDTAPETRVQTRVRPAIAEWLADRADRMHTGSTHLQAKLELDLWHTVLAAELRRIRLTLAEASCLADIFNASALDASVMDGPVGIVYAEAFDAFRMARDTPLPDESSYAQLWGIDEQSLLNRLGQLGPAADHALRDAISRWWEQDKEMSPEGFRAVGMTIVDPTDGRAAGAR